MARQREDKKNQPHIPPKTKTPSQKGDRVRRMYVRSTYAVYSVCAVNAKTNEGPSSYAQHLCPWSSCGQTRTHRVAAFALKGIHRTLADS